MQQYVQGFLPKTYDSEWRTALQMMPEANNLPNLRNRDYNDLIVPYARLSLTETFPLTSFPKVWNEFVNYDIKFIRDKIEFDKKLKALLLSKLDENYKCNRLLCNFCHLAV
jgi:hypothetical protein